MATVIEKRQIRPDGPDKVTGSGRYTADLTLTGMLHAKFLYAGVSHARITRLNTAKARSLPGVFAVITHEDVPDVQYGPFVQDRRLFCTDTVRFEADIVAAVAAVSAEVAERALALIEVDYEPLPIVDDLERALAADAPLVHAGWEAYGAADELVRSRNDASYSSIVKGDAEAALEAADIVVSERYYADASHAAPIEPRAILAQWEGDKVTIWTTTQVPFDTRAGVAETLRLPENRVRVIVPHLGGGFGGKCGFHFEAHVATLARKTGRPVRLVFSRREEFLAPDRRREGMLIDNGAYTADSGFFPQLAAMHIAGPYKIANVDVSGHLVYTNHQPSGSVRAPTAPQACWAVEQHTDSVARALGMDPVEFRRRNVVQTGDVGVSGQTYDVIGVLDCLEQATAAAGYGQELPADEAIGVAVGCWPSFAAASGAYVKLNGDGSGTIVTGAQECGTGAVMTLRMLAADELGMQPEDFSLLYQDTDAGPYDMGATGSQTLFNNGRAVVDAAQQLATQLRTLAADQMEAASTDIVLVDGHAEVKGSPEKRVSIADLAGAAHGGELLIARGSGIPSAAPMLEGSSCVGDVGMAAFTAPQFSCHAVRVKLDRDTGVTRVLAVATAHDSGTIINPQGAEGQVEGGVMMGIGQALTEGTQYDDEGRQRNAMMLEYKLQTIADAPPISIAWIQNPAADGGPRGAKGLAEAPNVATAAAIANAITKLTGRTQDRLPMTAERVWETMHA